MEKTIKLICVNCNKAFEKSLKEYKRQLKKGNIRFFCSLSCVCHKRNEENPPKGNLQNFKDNFPKKDEYTPFRWFVLRGKYRSKRKKYGCNITPEYIKEIWDNQSGICPFTGWKLKLPIDLTIGFAEKNPANASIDRIDNSIGYMQGNVRFVAIMANLARQSFTDEQVIDFGKAIYLTTNTNT